MKIAPFSLLFVFCFLKVWSTQSTCAVTKSVEAFGIVSEYYWRDFNGLVPTDAIPGGADESGATTYIGQFPVAAEYNYEISNIHYLTATITKGCEVATAAYHGRSVSSNETSSVKILCSGYTSRYKWYSKTSQFPPNCRFVIGGLEDNIPMYIGRATQGREKVIGKVFSVTTVHSPKLISPYQGGEITHDNFEVLTVCY